MLKRKHLLISVISVLSILVIFFHSNISAMALSDFQFIILSDYKAEMKIGDSFYLFAVTSTGKKASFSSSDSKIASVNTYGKITAKKSGTVTIYAKIKNAEASCKITVKPTVIKLNLNSASIENGTNLTLLASSDTATSFKWKSSKSSIASVNEKGIVTAKKPGEATITVSADGSSTTCYITVKKPTVTLNKTYITLYRKNAFQLSATVSSKLKPTWKSNRTSVATVDETGKVTAIKHGTAIITAKVDGVSKTCEVIVKQPEVSLNETVLNLKIGESQTLKATVSSGNIPTWSSANTSVAVVSDKGVVTAKQVGKTYIYATEDGIKTRCTLTVKE